ncbi:MAG: DUF2283 domain-containing protein [Bacillota bacterium]
MKITYDLEGDVLYILLREAKPDDSFDINPGITAELDENGELIGIEIVAARERGISLNDLHLENLPYHLPASRAI